MLPKGTTLQYFWTISSCAEARPIKNTSAWGACWEEVLAVYRFCCFDVIGSPRKVLWSIHIVLITAWKPHFGFERRIEHPKMIPPGGESHDLICCDTPTRIVLKKSLRDTLGNFTVDFHIAIVNGLPEIRQCDNAQAWIGVEHTQRINTWLERGNLGLLL